MDLTLFSIDNIFANLKKINPAINWAHAKPFPKEESRWLSRYHFHPQIVHSTTMDPSAAASPSWSLPS